MRLQVFWDYNIAQEHPLGAKSQRTNLTLRKYDHHQIPIHKESGEDFS